MKCVRFWELARLIEQSEARWLVTHTELEALGEA
jgi:hypothetical protein